MKKTFFLSIIILLLSNIGFSQITKFRAYSMQMIFKDADGSLGKSTEVSECNILTVMNSDEQNITIYTDPKESFDIIKVSESSYENSELLKLEAVGNDGKEVKITIIKYLRTGRIEIIIDTQKFGVIYNVLLL